MLVYCMLAQAEAERKEQELAQSVLRSEEVRLALSATGTLFAFTFAARCPRVLVLSF
jgi:hypothetical protein